MLLIPSQRVRRCKKLVRQSFAKYLKQALVFMGNSTLPEKVFYLLFYGQEQAESAKSRAWCACVLACLACLCAYVLTYLACLACFCTRVLNLRTSYDACLACSALAYSRFCLIIIFVCINQGFTIKGKLLIRVNLS